MDAKSTYYFFILVLFFSLRSNGTSTTDLSLVQSGLIANVYATNTYSDNNVSSDLYLLSSNGGWPNVNYKDTSSGIWAPITHLQRIKEMALALNSNTSKYYNSAAVSAAITNALNFWYTCMPAPPNGVSNSNCSVSSNWWYNDIGQQDQLQPILLLMKNKISNTLLTNMAQKYLISPAQYLQDTTGQSVTANGNTEGENLLNFDEQQLVRGILLQNVSDVSAAVSGPLGMQTLLNIVYQLDGIQEDWSFHQHNDLQSGSYGLSQLIELSQYVGILHGTSSFAFSSQSESALASWLLSGLGRMVRGQMIDYGVTGRYFTRAGQGETAPTLEPVCDELSAIVPSKASAFQALKNHIEGTGASSSYIGNTHFWNSDFMTHQRSSFYSSVKMDSNREYGTEQLNGENLLGYWLPYGMNLITQKGNEYENIFPVWDWALLPGVTAPDFVPYFPANSGIRYGGSFVGGVSDGYYGAAAMLISGVPSIAQNLTAYKSWFFFDNEYVALGAGISYSHSSATPSYQVNTSINQTLLNGEIFVNGSAVPSNQNSVVKNVSSVYHDGIGYIFPTAAEVGVSNIVQSGNWNTINTTNADNATDNVSANVFKLWIPHGVDAQNVTYRYIVAPGLSSPQAAVNYSTQQIIILSNSTTLQAVYRSNLEVFEGVFYKPATIQIHSGLKLKVDQPCMVVLREASKTLTVSNPSAVATTVTVTLAGGSSQQTVQKVNLSGGERGGKSLTVANIQIPN